MASKQSARDVIRATLTSLKQFLSQEEGTPKISEADTKANFIERYITALGYEGLKDIVREYYVKNSQEFIDYVLKVGGKPVLAIEAKPLLSELVDKHAAQLVQYCAVEGIEWCGLTNARQLWLFNQYIRGDLQAKLVLKLDLLAFNSDAEYDAVLDQLWLLSKESMTAPTGIRTWLEQKRLDQSIRALVLNPASSVIRQLRDEITSAADLQVTPEAIVHWFRSQLAMNVVAIPQASGFVSTQETRVQYGTTEPARSASSKYWLLPASKGDDGCLPVDQLRRWLKRGMWGMYESTPGRKHLTAGDFVCFYAAGVGVVAWATMAGSADTLIAPDEWPEPYAQKQPIYKVPLAQVQWLTSPIKVDEQIRAKLTAFEDRPAAALSTWSWFVQTTRSVSPHDFAVLTGQEPSDLVSQSQAAG